MHDVAMHFVTFPKTDFKPDNCLTLRRQIHINFIAVGTCSPTWAVHKPLTQKGDTVISHITFWTHCVTVMFS
jgi:hypothetical protein